MPPSITEADAAGFDQIFGSKGTGCTGQQGHNRKKKTNTIYEGAQGRYHNNSFMCDRTKKKYTGKFPYTE